MNLSNLQPNTPRKSTKRVGRGGKRGTFSGKGSKGQKSRAGASVRPGFRGGDNRIWQLFPKQRGASKKPGGKGIYAKHRFYQLKKDKLPVVNIEEFNRFNDEEIVTPKILFSAKGGPASGGEKGVNPALARKGGVKVLGGGELTRKLVFEGFSFSKSARDKIAKAGGTVK
ncbi:MAG: uL15 family ribosomal protein [Candidatus Yanofskybacteria bacterium]|nr:uL15 family ribosomal protein [Candidatus Yanofskybacteria bacterium]